MKVSNWSKEKCENCSMLCNYILHKGSNHLASSQDKLLHVPFTCMEIHCSIIAYISEEEKKSM